jgi:hypothetical protein
LVQALLLTAIALLSGNMVAAWIAHGLLATVFHCYLILAPWQRAATADSGAAS